MIRTPFGRGAGLAASLALAAAPSAAATCTGDTCQAAHSSLLAIAHDHNNPADTILYRVTLPEQPTGTAWGDGTNGFFYRVTDNQGQSYQTIVPFNGTGVDADGAPTLRPFSFIVKAPTTATQISVQACASNYVADGDAAKCSRLLWTDTYKPLPSPSVGAPAGFPATLSLSYLNNAVSVRNNGVYGARVLLKPSDSSLTEDQIDWLYNHLVFLDGADDVYTNDVLADSTASPSFAALPIAQAAHPTTPGGTEYNTKYGQIAQPVTPNDPSDTPNRWFWVYSTDTNDVGESQIQVGVGWLYDASADCPGALSGGDNSKASSCGGVPAPAGALGSANATLDLTVLDGSDVSVQAQSQHAAGTRFVRTVELSVGGSHDLCTAPVNPLAVNAANGINLPNYVIGPGTASGADSWEKAFPPALYYVLPTGFGNCAGDEAPFCQLTSEYTAYVPGYLDQNGLGGPLNGNSTASPLLGAAGGTFKLFDQYQLDDLAKAPSNWLVWFDNCGYGHLYHDDSLTARLVLPPADKPGSLPVFKYSIANKLDEPVVFAKDCCASLYQQNAATCTEQSDGTLTDCAYDPPQQIGSSVSQQALAGSGLYVPAGGSVGYSTLFSDELTTAYSAATGEVLFRLRLMPERPTVTNAGSATLFDCASPSTTATLSGLGADWTLGIGATGTGALACNTATNPQGACPWPMHPDTGSGVLAGYTTCTLNDSQRSAFILDVSDWAQQVLGDGQPVWLMGWGGSGDSGTNPQSSTCKGSCSGGARGPSGFAITVQTGAALARTPALYAYLGDGPTGNQSHGGSSTVLAKQPLTSLSSAQRNTLTPGEYVLLVAAGGGGGGFGARDLFTTGQGGHGGIGGLACANAAPGQEASVAGGSGGQVGCPVQGQACSGATACTGGGGGNSNGKGNGGSGGSGNSGGKAGIGGFGGNYGWLEYGSLVGVGSPLGSGDGPGPNNYGGGGGGGYGGGGGSESCSGSGGAGAGGGGGSFAAVNTAQDALAPTSDACAPPVAPSGYDGMIQFAYAGDAIAFPNKLSTQENPNLTSCLAASSDTGYVLRSTDDWHLAWQGDGNLVLYDTQGTAPWATRTNYPTSDPGAQLCFQGDGNLVVYNASGTSLWASDTADNEHGGNGGRRLAFDGPCEVAILNADNQVLWSTGTSCD